MKKLNLFSIFLTATLSALTCSLLQAQTAKELLVRVQDEAYPDEDHSNHAYYCYNYSSGDDNINLALNRDEVVPMGVLQIILPGGGNKAVFFFLVGAWTDEKNGTFTMYMFDDKNESIIEENEQEITI